MTKSILAIGALFAIGAQAAEELPRFAPKGKTLPVGLPNETASWMSAIEGWYRGGPETIVAASSVLLEESGRSHPAEESHDGRFDTAWVEGKSGAGIGESLTFEFVPGREDAKDLALTGCLIASGYQRSPDLFKKNARPKTLKLLYDGKAVALLELRDSPGMQRFNLPKLSLARSSRRKVGFEIVDVHPGSTHQDTCITEVIFDGEGEQPDYVFNVPQAREAVLEHWRSEVALNAYFEANPKAQRPANRAEWAKKSRAMFEHAMAGEIAALTTVFVDPAYHSGDNESWFFAAWPLMHAVGDERFAAYLKTLTPKARTEVFAAIFYEGSYYPRAIGSGYFGRRFPQVAAIYRTTKSR